MKQITMTTEDGVATVTIANPPAGYMNAETLAELDEATAAIDDDPAVRAVVYTGGVEGVFIRHYDVGELQALAAKLRARDLKVSEDRPIPERDIDRIFERIETSPKPAIAAINGHCMGGGLEFALACDIRIVASGPFSLGPIESQIGILPGAGGTVRLARLIGTHRALELCLRGRAFGPEEAVRLGIASGPVDDAVAAARTVAADLVRKPPKTLAHIKRIVRASAPPASGELLALERTLFLDLLLSESAGDLIAAFNRGEIKVTAEGAND